MNSDKLYVIIIIGMIGIFIYWYQTRLDQDLRIENQKVYCADCKRRMIKRKDKKKSDDLKMVNRSKSNSKSKSKSKSQSRSRSFRKEHKEGSNDHPKDRHSNDSIDSVDSNDSIPDSIVEARLNLKAKSKSKSKSKSDTKTNKSSNMRSNMKSNKGSKNRDADDDSEISLESLDTIDRSEASNSRKDDDTLSMVDGTLDSNAGTIDID